MATTAGLLAAIWFLTNMGYGPSQVPTVAIDDDVALASESDFIVVALVNPHVDNSPDWWWNRSYML